MGSSSLLFAAMSCAVALACGSAADGERLGGAPPGSGAEDEGPANPDPELVETEVDAGDGEEVPADACPRARVAVPPGNGLNLRETPSIDAPILDVLPNNAIVTVIERVVGSEVLGSTEWLEVGADPKDGFIAAAFAKCTTDTPPVLNGMPQSGDVAG